MLYKCPCGGIHSEEEWHQATIAKLVHRSGSSYEHVLRTFTTFQRAREGGGRFIWFICPTCNEEVYFIDIAEVEDGTTPREGIRSETGWHTYDDTYSYSVPDKVLIPF